LLVLPSAVKRIIFINQNITAVPIAHPLPIGLLTKRNLISNGGIRPIPHVNKAEISSVNPKLSPYVGEITESILLVLLIDT